MKNITFYLAFAMMPMFFVSCDSDQELVKETGEKFIDAVLANDLTTVKTMVTPETYNRWGDAYNIHEAVLTPELKENLLSVKTHVLDVTVDGGVAWATLSVGIPSEAGEIFTLHFKKLGRSWLIHEPGVLIKRVFEETDIIVDTDQ